MRKWIAFHRAFHRAYRRKSFAIAGCYGMMLLGFSHAGGGLGVLVSLVVFIAVESWAMRTVRLPALLATDEGTGS